MSYKKTLKTIKEKNDLKKGSRQRKIKFNPKSDIGEGERYDVENWISGNQHIGRGDVAELKGNSLKRGIHKLHSVTESKRHPKTGERMFLMHRGVGVRENNDSYYSHSELTSWTPHKEIADNFASDYHSAFDPSDNDDHEKEYGYRMDDTKPHTWSAWIPESQIHHIPNAIGSKFENNDSDSYHPHVNPKQSNRHEEHEIIVKPHSFIKYNQEKDNIDNIDKKITERRTSSYSREDNLAASEKDIVNTDLSNLEKNEEIVDIYLESLEKGEVANALKAGVGLLGLAHGAHYVGSDSPKEQAAKQFSGGNIPSHSRSIASVEGSTGEVKEAEASARKEANDIVSRNDKKAFLGSHNSGLSPHVFKQTIKSNPELKEKYHYTNDLSNSAFKEVIGKNPHLQKDVHNAHYDKLHQEFGGDHEKMSHAWHNGTKNTHAKFGNIRKGITKSEDKIFDSKYVSQHLDSTDPYGSAPDRFKEKIKSIPKWKKVKVPIDNIHNHTQHTSLPMEGVQFGESDEEIAHEYSEEPSHKFPAVILSDHPNGQGLYQTIDGAHRTRAAHIRGDSHIEAYVPHIDKPRPRNKESAFSSKNIEISKVGSFKSDKFTNKEQGGASKFIFGRDGSPEDK